jgi:hypothetical protein
MNADTTVTSTFTLKTYVIAASAKTGGSISPSGSITVSHGKPQNFAVSTNSGYSIADVKVDGASVGTLSSYAFSNVTANHTIEASFSAVPPPPPPPVTNYTLTITKAGTGSGSVTTNPSGTTFSAGTVVTFTAKPNKGSIFEGWSGAYTVKSTTCTLTINSDTTITATFTIKKHTIRATTGSEGSISPAGTLTVNEGENQAFTITVNEGYKIADVMVDGVSVGAVPSYVFTNVDNDHTIETTFTAITYSSWSDVMNKYQEYLDGTATWSEVMAVYEEYLASFEN